MEFVSMKCRFLPTVFLFAFASALAADEPKPPIANPKTDAERLAGTWLFDAAIVRNGNEQVGRFWDSTVAVSGDSFALSKLMGLSKDLKGKFVLDPAAK